MRRVKSTAFYVARGTVASIPGARRLYRLLRRGTTANVGGTNSAEYCYSVWLRHLVKAYAAGLAGIPQVVAEIGPGNSIGAGLAALLSGAQEYVGLDVAPWADRESNIAVFDELVELFRRRASIPKSITGSRLQLYPTLDAYDFPEQIISRDRLDEALRPERVAAIRSLLQGQTHPQAPAKISYYAPWQDIDPTSVAGVDFMFSQYVLQHVVALPSAVERLAAWLKPGGMMSHQISHHSHGTAPEWNGHWAYSDPIWRVVVAGRPYPLTRRTHSTYIDLFEKSGLQIAGTALIRRHDGVARSELSKPFLAISEDDLSIASSLIQAVKPATGRPHVATNGTAG